MNSLPTLLILSVLAAPCLVLAHDNPTSGAHARTESIDPAAWWTMDGTSSASEASPFLVPAMRGQALWLNGSNRLLGKSLGRFDRLSLSLWLRPARIHPACNTLVASAGEGGAMRLRIRPDARLELELAGQRMVTTATGLTPRRAWHHVAVAADAKAGFIRLYVDGHLAGEGPLGASAVVSLDEVVIGAGSGAAELPPMADDNMQGLIDELRLWRRTLSADEIRRDMQATPPDANGLVAAWSFDQLDEFPATDPAGYWGRRWQLGSATDPLLRMARFADSSGGQHNLGMPFVRDHSPLQQSDLGGFPAHGDGVGVIFNRVPSGLPDQAANSADLLTGNFAFVPGVRGQALKFDGFTTCGVRHPARLPDLKGGLTLEAWIAPQEYSLNQTAIINQYATDRKSGFFFGLDCAGKLVLGAAFDGAWREAVSRTVVPQLQWSHVAGVIDPAGGLTVFMDGKVAGEWKGDGRFAPAADQVCVIGESMQRMKAKHDHNHPFCYGMLPRMVFDGLMDELKLHARPLSAAEITSAACALKPAISKPLQMRRLPELPKGPRPFGAYHAKLKYTPEWDALHRSGDDADVVVQFDNSPAKLVFWRGANYIPALVSENGLWMSDQALEIAPAVGTCSEAIVDSQSRFSHVRVIENTQARVVVHWRCALPRPDRQMTNEDQNGWSDWGDEYWTVYPDGVCVRKQVLMTSRVVLRIDFVETILFNQPGMYPWDTVEWNAVTVGDLDGNQADWIWSREQGAPPRRADWAKVRASVKNTAIQRINFRSQFKPYSIWFPDRQAWPWGEGQAMYPYDCWNHWPVQQVQSDGINALLPDRPTHTSLNNGYWHLEPGDRPDSVKHKALYGMTDQPFASLLPLARSWNHPPAVRELAETGFRSLGYDAYQRAYVFECAETNPRSLSFQLAASERSPIANLALVVRNWGRAGAHLEIDGQPATSGSQFRLGHSHQLDSSTLVVWIQHAATAPSTFRLTPTK
jgi:hypothetical protein